MDDIWRVGDGGVLEVVRLLAVLFLWQKTQRRGIRRFQAKSSQCFIFSTRKSTFKIQKNQQ